MSAIAMLQQLCSTKLREHSHIAGKMKLAVLKGRFETGDELSAKHTSEYLDGEKEVRTGSNPAGVIE